MSQEKSLGETPLILYEDNHVLAVDKPHGLLTQPTDLEQDSLESRLKAFIKQRDLKPSAVYLHALHRLDKPAGGIVLFAKTSKALSRLQASFREKQIHKIYQADIPAVRLKKEGSLEHFLIHGDYRAIVAPDDPAAKVCRLHYKVIFSNSKTQRLEIDLETGRYHQIRAQLSAIGAPIHGDVKYGSTRPYALGIALRHVRMSFPHPTLNQLITVTTTGLPEII